MINSRSAESKWFLEGKSNDNNKWIIPIDKTPFLIGRTDKCDLLLYSKTVSRKHAELSCKFGEMYLRDTDSTNGTYINKKRIKDRKSLRHGDVINFGEFEFRIITKSYAKNIDIDSFTLYQKSPLKNQSFTAHYDLTKRESEILFYILEGKSTKKISEVLNISFGTSKNHIYNIFKKLDIHSRYELVAKYNNFSIKKGSL